LTWAWTTSPSRQLDTSNLKIPQAKMQEKSCEGYRSSAISV
jgi:hypothetical protein